MSKTKFELNKALQAAKLYNKIDYGNSNIPDVQQTMDIKLIQILNKNKNPGLRVWVFVIYLINVSLLDLNY